MFVKNTDYKAVPHITESRPEMEVFMDPQEFAFLTSNSNGDCNSRNTLPQMLDLLASEKSIET